MTARADAAGAERRQTIADLLTGNGYTSDEAFDVAKQIIAADNSTADLAAAQERIKRLEEGCEAGAEVVTHFREQLAAAEQTIRERDAENGKLRLAAMDARSGWRYIRQAHGDLYGVGWDRVENALTAALAADAGGSDA